MAGSTKVFSLCSLLMTLLFAYSASVQLNDPDWYFWFPLYACACVVNLTNWTNSSRPRIRNLAEVTLFLGTFLFLKVVIEDFVYSIAGFLSLDLSEGVVREKTGSGLVVISMLLHLGASSHSYPRNQTLRKKQKIPPYVEYGMVFLAAFSFGLPIIFFVIQNGEMKFDHSSEKMEDFQ